MNLFRKEPSDYFADVRRRAFAIVAAAVQDGARRPDLKPIDPCAPSNPPIRGFAPACRRSAVVWRRLAKGDALMREQGPA